MKVYLADGLPGSLPLQFWLVVYIGLSTSAVISPLVTDLSMSMKLVTDILESQRDHHVEAMNATLLPTSMPAGKIGIDRFGNSGKQPYTLVAWQAQHHIYSTLHR